MAVKIFLCYAREDEALLNKLKTHIRPLQRQGLIDVWHDRDISAGTEWEEEIDTHLNAADMILLLISSDFMDSDYCYGTEMQKALERHKRGEARVIPIILRPCQWRLVGLDKLEALPTDAIPAMSAKWHNVDEAFFDITEGIRVAAEKLISKQLRPVQKVSSQAPSLEPSASTETITSHLRNQARDSLYQQFFADVLERLKTVRPGATNAQRVQPESFWFFMAGKAGFYFQWAFRKNNTLRTELVINTHDREKTKKIFDSFFEERKVIEQEFGATLDWERLDAGKESHILLSKPARITDSPAELEETKRWAVDTMVKFVDVFQKRIKMLKI